MSVWGLTCLRAKIARSHLQRQQNCEANCETNLIHLPAGSPDDLHLALFPRSGSPSHQHDSWDAACPTKRPETRSPNSKSGFSLSPEVLKDKERMCQPRVITSSRARTCEQHARCLRAFARSARCSACLSGRAWCPLPTSASADADADRRSHAAVKQSAGTRRNPTSASPCPGDSPGSAEVMHISTLAWESFPRS